jgi:hypothetical protein
MKPEDSLSHLQDPATDHYPEPNETRLILVLLAYLFLGLPSGLFRFFIQNIICILHLQASRVLSVLQKTWSVKNDGIFNILDCHK